MYPNSGTVPKYITIIQIVAKYPSSGKVQKIFLITLIVADVPK